ncbi:MULTISPECIES: hypothetical protein [unclassified Plantactinospora]|uniref:hypothetical protein n=1 Tax=unclassified Plantactinospora TaxID=2631981 RepID=UPI000D15D0A9|nr:MULTISPECIES: hypothetical protein [unclassified Plantactinospora]AVT33564.1 hypothetical protein C6361_33595 [Plantactinospora sp. BC1]AVT39524.1 hypothetical protein C6W10_27240 [Plantactinospora sp. BB1]
MGRRTLTGLAGLATTVALGAACVVGLRLVHRMAEPPGRPVCAAEERAFAAGLATDPLLTRAPAGMELESTRYAEPCESLGAGNWRGGAVTVWAYPAGSEPPRQEIQRFYRELAERRGWPVREGTAESTADATAGGTAPTRRWVRTIDGRRVELRLNPDHRHDGRTVLLVSMTYRIAPRDGAVGGTERG